MCYFYIFMNHCIKKVMKLQKEKRTIKNSQETERVLAKNFTVIHDARRSGAPPEVPEP
jgi:hypothetical protein